MWRGGTLDLWRYRAKRLLNKPYVYGDGGDPKDQYLPPEAGRGGGGTKSIHGKGIPLYSTSPTVGDSPTVEVLPSGVLMLPATHVVGSRFEEVESYCTPREYSLSGASILSVRICPHLSVSVRICRKRREFGEFRGVTKDDFSQNLPSEQMPKRSLGHATTGPEFCCG
jgi:hypothetical protein